MHVEEFSKPGNEKYQEIGLKVRLKSYCAADWLLTSPVVLHVRGLLLRYHYPGQAQHRVSVDSHRPRKETVCLQPICRGCNVHHDEHYRCALHYLPVQSCLVSDLDFHAIKFLLISEQICVGHAARGNVQRPKNSHRHLLCDDSRQHRNGLVFSIYVCSSVVVARHDSGTPANESSGQSHYYGT